MKTILFNTFCTLGIALFPFVVVAVDLPSANQPLLISADEVIHDKERGVITAYGTVEI